MPSFLVGVLPKHNGATRVKKINFNTACCFPYSTSLHPAAYRHSSQSWRWTRTMSFSFYLSWAFRCMLWFKSLKHRSKKISSTLALATAREDMHCYILPPFPFYPRRNLEPLSLETCYFYKNNNHFYPYYAWDLERRPPIPWDKTSYLLSYLQHYHHNTPSSSLTAQRWQRAICVTKGYTVQDISLQSSVSVKGADYVLLYLWPEFHSEFSFSLIYRWKWQFTPSTHEA